MGYIIGYLGTEVETLLTLNINLNENVNELNIVDELVINSYNESDNLVPCGLLN